MRLKVHGLLALAVLTTMALGASANGTTVTSGGSLYTGTIKAANEIGHINLHNPLADIECSVSVEAAVSSHGSAVTAEMPLGHMTFTGCTNWVVTVNSAGSWSAHTIAGSSNATLTSSGTTISAKNIATGTTCNYTTNNTDIGTLTGSNTTKATATLDISASIPFHGGSIFCGAAASALTGTLLIATPDSLNFH